MNNIAEQATTLTTNLDEEEHSEDWLPHKAQKLNSLEEGQINRFDTIFTYNKLQKFFSKISAASIAH